MNIPCTNIIYYLNKVRKYWYQIMETGKSISTSTDLGKNSGNLNNVWKFANCCLECNNQFGQNLIRRVSIC